VDPWPTRLLDVARRQEGLVDVRQLDDAQVARQRMTRAVQAGRAVRAARGVYDLIATPPSERTSDPDRERDDVHDHRRRRSAWLGLLTHGPEAVGVGQTALTLHGVQGLPLRPRVEVTRVDRRERRSREGVTLRRYDVVPRFVPVASGRSIVPVDVALAQAVPELGRRQAIAVLDSTLHQGLLTRDGVRHAHDLARGRRGVESTHELWELADARLASPAESWSRIDCVDAGIPPDALQLVMHEAHGAFLARVDLAWWLGGGRWLVAEIDGVKAHAGEAALAHDSRRQNPIVAAGNVLLRYSGADAWAGVPALAIKPVLTAAGWRPGQRVPSGPVRLDVATAQRATRPRRRLEMFTERRLVS